MSHAIGAIRFPEGDIFYYEYNGTTDVVIPQFWATQEEVEQHWRSGEYRGCECKPIAQEPVEIMSTYGGGFWWTGAACRTCAVITDGFLPGDAFMRGDGSYHSGDPEWSPWNRKEMMNA